MTFAILPPNSPMVKPDGYVTPEWYRFLSAVHKLIGGTLLEQLQQGSYITWQAEDVLPNDRVLAVGTALGLTVGATNATVSLEDTAVTAGSYGGATKTASFTVDAQGRLTAASDDDLNTDNITEGAANLFFTNARARAALAGGTGISYDSGTGVITLADTAITPGSYGSATSVPTFTVDQQGRLTAAGSAAVPVLASGTYTPTLTNVTNLDASASYSAQYLRVGNTVTVSGRVDVDPTAAAAVELGISLPVASNFANVNECGGTASPWTIAGEVGGIAADTVNDRATLRFVAATTANRAMAFTFTYRII